MGPKRKFEFPPMTDEERERWNKEWAQWKAEFETEDIRYENLSLDDKMKEDGKNYQDQMNEHPSAMLLLQQTPRMGRAQCRARICIGENALKYAENRILLKTGTAWYNGGGDRYFHVECLEKMLDLPDLAPTRLQLDNGRSRDDPCVWGLMVTKWLECKGRIDLQRLEEHLEAIIQYRKDTPGWEIPHLEWSEKHQIECVYGKKACTCPPAPKGETEPVLGNIVTGEDVRCSLSEVLRHKHGGNGGVPVIFVGVFGHSYAVKR